jgi:rod shape-determining protein MreC
VRKRASDRKDQSRIAAVRFLLLVGTILTVALLVLASMIGDKFGAAHQLTLDIISPLQRVVSKTVDGFTDFSGDYIGLWNVRSENKRLRMLVDKYLNELGKYREAYRTYLHLQTLLEFKEQQEFKLLSARVVGKDPAYWFQTILVDRGKADDIEEGMVVLTPQGVVGQIIHVSEHYAKVLLANAPSSAIDAMVQKSRMRGILKGAGEKGFVLNYVLKKTDVAVGDHIVTAGIGGVFAPGIPLGVVSAVREKERGMFMEIEVQPSVDFQKLEYVFIDPTDRQKILREMNLTVE